MLVNDNLTITVLLGIMVTDHYVGAKAPLIEVINEMGAIIALFRPWFQPSYGFSCPSLFLR